MHFRKYIDRITSKFYSNSRYASSFFYTLKFFFEKNTKHFNVVDKLGNVYRSSKWVDLKLQNLNATSLVRLLFFVSLFVFGSLLTMKLGNPFFADVLEAPRKLVLHIIDSAYYSWLLLVALSNSIIAKIRNYVMSYVLKMITISNYVNPFRKQSAPTAQLSRKSTPLSKSALFKNTRTSASNDLLLPGIVEFYNLQTALTRLERSFFNYKKLFDKPSPSAKILTDKKPSKSDAELNSLKLYQDTMSFIKDPKYEVPSTTPYITDLEDSFSDNLDIRLCDTYKYTYSSSAPHNIFVSFKFSIERNLISNTTANLALGRENRWLSKSNIFSNSLTKTSNSLSQAKKYINNPLFSSFSLNRNLWASTKLTDNADLQALNLTDDSLLSSGELTTSHGGKSSYSNLNFMEDSVLWNLNRFTSYQGMQTMQHTSTNFAKRSGVMHGVKSESFLPVDTKLALVDYHFISSKLLLRPGVPAALSADVSSTTATQPQHLNGGADSLLLNHYTLSLLEVYFPSVKNRANKLFFFFNI